MGQDDCILETRGLHQARVDHLGLARERRQRERVDGRRRNDLCLHVRLESEGKVLARDTYGVIAGEVHRQIGFSDPGIEDYLNELLWSPEQPTLILTVPGIGYRFAG